MKHTIKITLILLGMFLITQFIGIFVISQYSPQVIETIDQDGNFVNVTSNNLPYGMDPPENIQPTGTLISIIFALIIAVSLMFLLMKYKAEVVIRIWFFIVVSLAIAITVNSFIIQIPISALIAIIIAVPLAFLKIFKR